MDWLNEAALRLREWLMQQVWLDGWQSSIAQTPDWALVTACPGFALLLALLLWAQAPRSKRAAKHAEPETSPSKPQAGARAETTAASAAAATSSAQEAPEPATTTMRGEATRREAQAEAQATIPVRRASGVPGQDEQERKARVFLSSTFRDMGGEREVLATKTFPALKRDFRKSGVEVQAVDLRWGVNAGDPTLDICLAAVKRSNWFVGLIGQRYGTTEEDEAKIKQLAKSFPSIREGVGRSLTELEILEGVLANGPGDKQVLFFERDPAWLDELSPSRRGDYEDPPPRAELNDLSRRIQERVGAMHVYASPGDIDVVFKARMTEALEKAFPPLEGVDDPFMQEHRLHAAYARERLEPYIADDDNVKELNDWMADTSAAPKLIVGESGGGKSALIANWTTSWARAHPTDIIFVHYLGASPDSANPAGLVRRLWLHLNRATGEEVAVPGPDTKIDALRDLLSGRLAQANAFAAREGCQVVTVLDGLDKLSDEHRDLRWWPRALPPRIKVLASSLDGKARDAARDRYWTELAIKPFDAAQQGTFIAKTLEGWEKSDFPDQRKQLVLAHEMAGLPLFLKTILEELRVSAEHAELEDRLVRYLTAERMPDLFKQILAQIETECGKDFVAHALSLIWAGRAGLEEDEIIAITGATNLAWERLRNRLADNLRDTQGRVAFSHDYLRQAVEADYLKTKGHWQKAHLDIASRFQKLMAEHSEDDGIAPRIAEELPYQLRAAGEAGNEKAWDHLQSLLVDLDRFMHLHARGNVELLSYWLALKRDPEVLLCNAFEARTGGATPFSEASIDLAFLVSDFLRFAGATSETSQRMEEQLVSSCRLSLGDDHPSTLTSMSNLASTLQTQGDFEGALRLQREVYEKMAHTLGNDDSSTLVAMNNLAATLHRLGDWEGAQRLKEVLLEARLRLLGESHVETLTSVNNLAVTLHARGDLDGAKLHFERAVRELSRTLGPDHPHTLNAMNGLGLTLSERGDIGEAEALQQKVVDARTRVLGPDHASTLRSLDNLSQTLARQGERSRARAIAERVLERSASVNGADHPDTLTSMNNLAVILWESDAFDEACELQQRVSDERSRILGKTHPHTLASNENLIAILGDMLMSAKALKNFSDLDGEQVSDDVLTSMSSFARKLRADGDLDGAQRFQERVLKARTSILGPEHPDTLWSMNSLAGTLRARGDLEGAQSYQERVLEANLRLLGLEHGRTLASMNNLAGILRARGNLAGARSYQERALETMKRVLGAEDPLTLTSMSDLAETLRAIGDLAGALRLAEVAVDGSARVLGRDHPATKNAMACIARISAEIESSKET